MKSAKEMTKNCISAIIIVLLLSPVLVYSQGGLVAHWTFEEGEGTTVTDNVGGYVGEFEGTVEWAAGKIGESSLYFNGTDASVQTDLFEPLQIADEITMCLWFNTEITTASVQQHLLWIGDSTGNGWGGQQELHMTINHFNYMDKLILAFADGADTDGRMVNIISDDDFWDVDNWHHLAGVIKIEEGDTSMVTTGELYLDGEWLAPMDHEFPTEDVVYDEIMRDDWNKALKMGVAGNGSRRLVGYLDDVQIYDRALTPEEIATVMTGETATAVDGAEAAVASNFKLLGNYPNPFNPTTKISYSLQNSGMVNLKIYSATGREIQHAVSAFQNAGPHTVTFDASDLPSGIYFYTLQVDNVFSETQKMVLVK